MLKGHSMITSLFQNRRFTLSLLLATVLPLTTASPAYAVTIATADPAIVAAFQSGAAIEKFDDLTAFPITSYAAGQTIDAPAKFSSRNGATQPTFHSGGASPSDPVGNPGSPIGIFAPQGGIAGDVNSSPNVAGPLVIFTDEPFNNGFLEVIFPANVSRVGFWVTSGAITLSLRDVSGSNLTGEFQVTGLEGQFIGIERGAADVKVAALIGSGTDHFTIDDFTWGTRNGTSVPEAGSLWNLAFAGAFLWFTCRTLKPKNG